MLSNRIRRVYDGYLKNSRFYRDLPVPHSTQRHHRYTIFLLWGEGLVCLSWWRLLTRLLWGLGEQHGGKHCKERQQQLTAGVSSGYGDALLGIIAVLLSHSSEVSHDKLHHYRH